MVATGKDLRLRRLIQASSGRTVIVPLDQGTEEDFGELEDVRPLVRELAVSGADGFLMRRGMASFALEALGCQWRVGLSTDGTQSVRRRR
jgi:DhnA family fructose-bisphosphate aldolase class Ia